ncbi:MAG: phage GP46 family protein [Fibrobacter sp.]|nr:phage GP46 family protein [Fibrobacter sp.]MBR4680926.1 phage GP46 family protein [Fibrobacter sp.]MBR6941946.1 phage GP46 family protein [Fibrobacter sp.]
MNKETLLEEIHMSLTVAKGCFFKRPEFGHRFKELRNVPASETTRKKCEAYALEALQWLVEYKHLRSVKANATVVSDDKILLQVECDAYVGETITFKRFVEVGYGH